MVPFIMDEQKWRGEAEARGLVLNMLGFRCLLDRGRSCQKNLYMDSRAQSRAKAEGECPIFVFHVILHINSLRGSQVSIITTILEQRQ